MRTFVACLLAGLACMVVNIEQATAQVPRAVPWKDCSADCRREMARRACAAKTRFQDAVTNDEFLKFSSREALLDAVNAACGRALKQEFSTEEFATAKPSPVVLPPPTKVAEVAPAPEVSPMPRDPKSPPPLPPPPPKRVYIPAPAPQVVYVPPPPPPARVQDTCAWVEATIDNWGDREAVFRITAVGGRVPNGRLEMPARWNPRTHLMCIPRALFAADVVQVCIGTSSVDHSNSKLIRGRWMEIARANLSRGSIVNPGQPMPFRYNGPIAREYRYHPMAGPVPYSYQQPSLSVGLGFNLNLGVRL